ncbi:MAG: M48 family metalloprotease [Alphaproteobacteria bacterium]|nr:M48 family metalloprotease [Alphaproteobacteria bacterium]
MVSGEHVLHQPNAFGDEEGGDIPKREPERIIVQDGISLLRLLGNGIVNNDVLEDYLNQIATKLLAHSPKSNVPIKIKVIATSNYGEACAYHDGVVGIPMGFLEISENEDQIAALAAHEIAHVILGHHDLDYASNLQNGMVGATEVTMGAVQELGVLSGNLGAKAELASIGARLLLAASSGVLLPSFNREQEDEADLLGLDLLIKAGYNTNGMFQFFDKLIEWEEGVKQRREEAAALAKAQREKAQEQQFLSGGYASFLGSAISGIEEKLQASGEKHRESEERQVSLAEYFDREYADYSEPLLTTKPWVDIKRHPTVIGYFNGYAAALEAMPLAKNGDYQGALRIVEPHLSGPMGNETALRLLDHDIKLNLGRYEEARETLEVAIQAPDAAFDAFQKLGQFANLSGDYQAGLKVYESAFDEFAQAGNVYPPLITQFVVVGDKKKARQFIDRCRVNHRAFAKFCEKAASPEMVATTKAGRLSVVAAPRSGGSGNRADRSTRSGSRDNDGGGNRVGGLSSVTAVNVGETVTTSATSLNVRSGPSVNNGVVAKLTKGSSARVTAVAGGWAFIELESGTGWVSAKYLEPLN